MAVFIVQSVTLLTCAFCRLVDALHFVVSTEGPNSDHLQFALCGELKPLLVVSVIITAQSLRIRGTKQR